MERFVEFSQTELLQRLVCRGKRYYRFIFNGFAQIAGNGSNVLGSDGLPGAYR